MTGRLLREAVVELRRNLVRTLLTASGVTVAVTAFTLVAGIGEIARSSIRRDLEGVGGRAGTVALTLETGAPLGEAGAARAADVMTERLGRYGPVAGGRAVLAASETVRRDIAPLPSKDPDELPCGPSTSFASPVDESAKSEQSAFAVSSPCTLPVYAVDPELLSVMGAPMVAGRWLRAEDARSAAVPVVVSKALATQLRDVEHPTLQSLLGSVIRDEELVQQPLVVVGVVGDNAVTNVLGQPGAGFVPFEARSRFVPKGSRGRVTAMAVTEPAGAERIADTAAADARALLTQAGFSRPAVSGERIDEAGALASALRVLDLVLLGIALLTMGLGAIGVLNVSLMTVRQRVREFGLRRAVGARPRDLSVLVLCESVLVTLVGGMVGVGVAMLVALVAMPLGADGVSDLGLVGIVRPAVLGLLVAAATGMAGGLVPALRAVRISVLDALRR
ncbi:MAG: ABC transporter permease [Actinomycetota bacterium]|nr:ABC transporter permease [Actinomycetota bacterium]